MQFHVYLWVKNLTDTDVLPYVLPLPVHLFPDTTVYNTKISTSVGESNYGTKYAYHFNNTAVSTIIDNFIMNTNIHCITQLIK